MVHVLSKGANCCGFFPFPALNILHRLSCDLPFAQTTSPLLTTTKIPFEDYIDRSLCEVLRKLGIEGQMRLGRVQGPIGSLETQDISISLVDSAVKGINLRLQLEVAATRVFQSMLPIGQARHHRHQTSMGMMATLGGRNNASFLPRSRILVILFSLI